MSDKIPEDIMFIRDSAKRFPYLGIKIRKRREEYGLSREKLCEKLDISAYYLFEIETGKKVPSLLILKNICHVLSLSIDYVTNDTPEQL